MIEFESCFALVNALFSPLFNALSIGLFPLFALLNTLLGVSGSPPTDFGRVLPELLANLACSAGQDSSI